MNRLRKILNSVLPYRIRRLFRDAHRHLVFGRALKRFLKDPSACTNPGNPILLDLIYGWGNEGWSALNEYLSGCIEHSLNSRGPILECGSGLSTILVGAIATKQSRNYWVLEHTPEWAAKVYRYLNRYKFDGVILCSSPLKDYGTFCWYDAPLESMPDNFSMVICDGPPGATKGGRYGLVPIMRERLGQGCVILLDDAGREEDRTIAKRWRAELGASLEILGSSEPYIKLRVLDKPIQHPA